MGVMFGYMLIATEPLYGPFTFLNDHPALPNGPVGTYQEVIAELIRTRATESGCLMNIVDGNLDRGPVVSYCRYPTWDASNQILWRWDYPPDQLEPGVRERLPLYKDLRARGVAREKPFLVETLHAVADGTLSLPPSQPVDLTERVEAAVLRDAREARKS
jgi:phosphoribosylglycinamide formyltransferase-1